MLKKQEEPEGRLDGLMKVDTMEWRSEGCSLHAVALLDSIWIDKWHQLSLPT